MTLKHLAGALTASAVLLAGAAPAASAQAPAPPDIPVADGVIEHRVLEQCTTATGTYTRFNVNGCLRADFYIASDRDHELWHRGDELVGESATVDRSIFVWTRVGNELVVGPVKYGQTKNLSRLADAGLMRESVRQGLYTVTGEEVRDGRAVLVLAAKPDPEFADSTTVVVDKATYQPLERRFASHDGGLQVTYRLVSDEDLPRTAANEGLLKLRDHGAVTVKRVDGDGATMARAARKVGLKSKVRAKIQRKARAKARAKRR